MPDQVHAVGRLARHLHRPGTRALFVSATGTGKALTSIRVADELDARLVLFVVPRRRLALPSRRGRRMHGHLAAPATTPVGAWLAEQRHLATKNTLEAARAEALTALAAGWRLPHGADWHRKYHLLRAHLAGGADPTALTRDTQLGGVKIGSWLARQLTAWHALTDGQQQLMTALGLTPETNPLTPARRTRRTFEQTVQLLELFLHREGRVPAARESIRVDGESVRIGAWLAKARTKHRACQLSEEHARLVAALFDGDWTVEDAVPAVLA